MNELKTEEKFMPISIIKQVLKTGILWPVYEYGVLATDFEEYEQKRDDEQNELRIFG